jgi:hypothetical protein
MTDSLADRPDQHLLGDVAAIFHHAERIAVEIEDQIGGGLMQSFLARLKIRRFSAAWPLGQSC